MDEDTLVKWRAVDRANNVRWHIVTKCGACGMPFTRDLDYPLIEDRACECMTCPVCGREYRPDDDNGPQVAKRDEDARMDGWCAPCQRKGSRGSR